VAQILALHLWETGEVPETEVDLPRRLKYQVSRALSGVVLTPSTLRTFIAAFDMRPDAADLWTALTGADPGRFVVLTPDASAERLPAQFGLYTTVSSHDWHRLGPDGLPASNRTLQVIRAVQPVDRYTYRFDTNAAVVEVIRGGTASSVRPMGDDGLFAVDIELSRRLTPGETISLEYETTFAYRIPPPPEFRRATQWRAGNVTMDVKFHPHRLPHEVRWSVWERLDDVSPSRVLPVELGSDHTAHRHLDAVEGAVVGFEWDF
jgi:hypothetical protein